MRPACCSHAPCCASTCCSGAAESTCSCVMPVSWVQKGSSNGCSVGRTCARTRAWAQPAAQRSRAGSLAPASPRAASRQQQAGQAGRLAGAHVCLEGAGDGAAAGLQHAAGQLDDLDGVDAPGPVAGGLQVQHQEVAEALARACAGSSRQAGSCGMSAARLAGSSGAGRAGGRCGAAGGPAAGCAPTQADWAARCGRLARRPAPCGGSAGACCSELAGPELLGGGAPGRPAAAAAAVGLGLPPISSWNASLSGGCSIAQVGGRAYWRAGPGRRDRRALAPSARAAQRASCTESGALWVGPPRAVTLFLGVVAAHRLSR
jgi:hypothetical protein